MIIYSYYVVISFVSAQIVIEVVMHIRISHKKVNIENRKIFLSLIQLLVHDFKGKHPSKIENECNNKEFIN